MADTLDNIIFGKKKFSDLLKEVYDNQKKKETQITSLIKELQPLVKTVSDATLMVPLIKEYLEIGVKNDEHLIKLATVIQRVLSTKSSEGNDMILTEDERKQIMEEVSKLNK